MRISEEQLEAGDIGERAAVAFFVAIAGLALAPPARPEAAARALPEMMMR